MGNNELIDKLNAQRKFLADNPVISLEMRKLALKTLYKNIKEMIPEIEEALKKDLNKCKTESYMTEIGLVLSEISFMLRHLRHLSRKKYAYSPISNFPSKSYRKASAYGVVLIVSPWNYPFLLAIEPLVDAISAGNTVILKPSSNSVNVSKVIEKLIAKSFAPTHATTIILNSKVDGDFLLEQKYDYIFYTGSTRVGQIVMRKATENFTPVTLEMGGKSPCIVDETANLELAAKRIVFGKFLNAGQTCVAPDYIICQENIKDKLIEALEVEIIRQYSVDPILNKNYPKMINQKQFDFAKNLISEEKLIFGGKTDETILKIEPTLVNATLEDECMSKEIFAPILPILTFNTISDIDSIVMKNPNPLAFYVFTKNRKFQKQLLEKYQFGGCCVNDTIMHIANNHLAFGGVRESGIGQYHGKYGFETFSHFKSVVKKRNWIDIPLRYQPYNKIKRFFIKMFLK